MKKSLESSRHSVEYTIKNKIIAHLNTATGLHAIERGYGSIILGSDEGISSPQLSQFIELREKGDAEAFQAEKYINELLNINNNKSLKKKLDIWHEGYQNLLTVRPKIEKKDAGIDEWIKLTTQNINNELDLRNIIFTSESMNDRIIYMSSILGHNVSRLCEFAGLERALIGNTIASGKTISESTYNDIKRYSTIVDISLDQILIIKDLLDSSDQMRQALLEFEREFQQSFQFLREDIFAASRKVEDEKITTLEQMNKMKMDFENYLSGVSNDILNISKHENVIALAANLKTGNDSQFGEKKRSVINLLETFSQVKMIYDQIRFIDNNGQECVRVDFNGSATTVISQPMLQDKSDMYYFRESVNMPPGSVYISPIDLNVKHGKIEIPYKPVIRFATPVFVNGEQAGIVVFNVAKNSGVSILAHNYTESVENEGFIFADQNGFYLHHPDKGKEWGMMKSLNKSRHNIRQDYPDIAEQILSGGRGIVRSATGKEILYESFFPGYETNPDKFWVIIKQLADVQYPVSTHDWFDAATKAINTGLAISKIADEESNAFMAGVRSEADRNLLINLIILGFVVLFFLYFIKWTRTRILVPIQKLTSATQKIERGEYGIKADVESNDEIGLLTANFNKMAEGLTKEIKERRHAEKLLKKSEEEYRLLIESAQDAVICINEMGIIYIWNRLAEKLFGYTKGEVVGKSVTIIIPEKFKSQHKNGIDRFLKTGVCKIIGKSIEVFGKTKAGMEIPIELSLSFYKTEDEQYFFLGIIRDLSERKRVEEVLLRSEKMKSMGMITSGVAHEFNNILAIVKGFAFQIKKRCGDNKKIEKRIDTIINASNDGIEIVRRMREFTNREIMDSSKFIPTDMRELVEQAIEFTMPRWYTMAHAENITYIMDTQGLNRGINVLGNQTELREVLINVIYNALDAMPEGGKIFYQLWSDGKTVYTSISDTGEGMSKEIQMKIFDPFFSTKQIEGTGLGLSASYGIVIKHGGRIDVESEEGKGSTFTICLPVTTQDVFKTTTAQSVTKIMRKNLRILIVDDEKNICDVLSEFFIKEGHNVKSVFSGADAVKLLNTEEFDLVLSDMIMPEVSGSDIINAVHALEHRPKIGIITGWLNTGCFEKEEILKADFVSRKPFDFAELTKSINNVMGKRLSDDKETIKIENHLSKIDISR